MNATAHDLFSPHSPHFEMVTYKVFSRTPPPLFFLTPFSTMSLYVKKCRQSLKYAEFEIEVKPFVPKLKHSILDSSRSFSIFKGFIQNRPVPAKTVLFKLVSVHSPIKTVRSQTVPRSFTVPLRSLRFRVCTITTQFLFRMSLYQ